MENISISAKTTSSTLTQTDKLKSEEGPVRNQNRVRDSSRGRGGRPTQRKRYTRRNPNPQRLGRKTAPSQITKTSEVGKNLASNQTSSDIVSQASIPDSPTLPSRVTPKPEGESENIIDRITGFFGKTSKGRDLPSSGADS